MALLDIPVNWGTSYTSVLQYDTEICVSRSGYEQRIAWLAFPRKRLEYDSLLDKDRVGRYKRKVQTAHGEAHTVPDYVRSVTLTGALNVGGSSVVMTSTPQWMYLGRKVVIGAPDNLEEFTVSGIAGTMISLTPNAAKSHPLAGLLMYAGVVGRLATALQATAETSTVVAAKVAFSPTPSSETDAAPPAAPLTFNSREVFMRPPNWESGLELDFFQSVEVIDFGYSMTSTSQPMLFSEDKIGFKYANAMKAESLLVEDLFTRAVGRQREFYIPTWQDDVPLKDTIGIGNNFVVTERSIYDDYFDTLIYKAICIVLKDGTYINRVITSFTVVDANYSRINLNTTFPATLTIDKVEMICWLPVCRFASDILQTEWMTDEVSVQSFTVQILPALTPEV